MNRVALRLSTLALAAATFAGARTASAQVSSPFHFGIGGGVSLPQSDASNDFKAGFHGQAMVGLSVPVLPVGLRGDFVYHQMSGKNGLDADLKVLGGGVNVMYDLPGVMVKPYLSAGLGMYNAKVDAGAAGSASETKVGFNGGAGIKFNLTGFNTLLEARYYSIQTSGSSTTFVPITFGIMF